MLSSTAWLRWVGLAVAASMPLGLVTARGDDKLPASVGSVHRHGKAPAAFAVVPDPEPDLGVTFEPVGPAALPPQRPVRSASAPRAVSAPHAAVAVVPPAVARAAVATVQPPVAHVAVAAVPPPVAHSAVPAVPPPGARVAVAVVQPAAPAPVRAAAAVGPMIDGQAPPLAVSIAFAKYRASARVQADALAQTLRGLGLSVDEVAVGTVRARTPRIGYIFAADRPAALAISVNAGAQYGFVDPVSMPFSVVPGARPGLIAIILPG